MSGPSGPAGEPDRPQRRQRIVLGCLAAGVVAIAVLVALVTVTFHRVAAPAGGRYLVKNNSSAVLRCRTDRLGGWGPAFDLAPAAEFSEHGFYRLKFFCGSPMKRVAYGLEPGQRYAILPAGEGRVELRRIATR